MNLSDKIEEIRQKPEGQRIIYVWSLVAISMVVVISIWLFSFKEMLKGGVQTNNATETPVGLESIEKMNEKNNNKNLENEMITPSAGLDATLNSNSELNSNSDLTPNQDQDNLGNTQ